MFSFETTHTWITRGWFDGQQVRFQMHIARYSYSECSAYIDLIHRLVCRSDRRQKESIASNEPMRLDFVRFRRQDSVTPSFEQHVASLPRSVNGGRCVPRDASETGLSPSDCTLKSSEHSDRAIRKEPVQI